MFVEWKGRTLVQQELVVNNWEGGLVFTIITLHYLCCWFSTQESRWLSVLYPRIGLIGCTIWCFSRRKLLWWLLELIIFPVEFRVLCWYGVELGIQFVLKTCSLQGQVRLNWIQFAIPSPCILKDLSFSRPISSWAVWHHLQFVPIGMF